MIFKKIVSFLSSILFFCLLSGSAFSATIGLRAVDPNIVVNGDIVVDPSTVFEVELYAEGLDSIPNLTEENPFVGFVLNVVWDPLVAFEGFENNAQWWSTIDVSPAPGPDVIPTTVELNGYAAATAPFEDHVIGTFILHCLGPGDTTLEVKPRFDVPFNLALKNGNFFDLDVSYGNIKIHQTPIPSAGWLLGSGLVGLLGIGRNRYKR